MINCRNHPYEQSVGVCASCLRDRLRALIAVQSGRPQACCAGVPVHQGPPGSSTQQQQKRPPPPAFPRSVSPYVSRRRPVDLDFLPDADDRCRRRPPVLFYSTPQVETAAARGKGAGAGFSLFSSLFSSVGGRQFSPEHGEQDSGASRTAARPSSWFAALIPGRSKKNKKKESKQFAAEAAEDDSVRRRRAWCRDRGMSPAGDGSGGEDRSESGSGYLTESPHEWRWPAPTPLRKPASPAHRAMSGFVVCLSPLVRASPRRSHVGEGSGAAALAGEVRGAAGLGGHCRRRRHHHQHASGGWGPPPLRPNRSRKLADIGRFR